jgi:hypothetical protein
MTVQEMLDTINQAESCIDRLNQELAWYKQYAKDLEKELEKIEIDNKV